MQFEIDEQSRVELVALLDSALGDLSHEIADTDSPTYRRRLRQRREVLAGVRSTLEGGRLAAGTAL